MDKLPTSQSESPQSQSSRNIGDTQSKNGFTEIVSVTLLDAEAATSGGGADVRTVDSRFNVSVGDRTSPYKFVLEGSSGFFFSSTAVSAGFRPKAIQIVVDREVFAHTNYFQFTSGRLYYAISVGLLGFGRTVNLDVFLTWVNINGEASEQEQRIQIGTIVCRRVPREIERFDGLRPLLVSGLGRSGTTRMMQLLLRHTQIVALPKHPFENQPAQYWLHALRVLSSPAERNSETPIVGFQQANRRLTPNPFHHPVFLMSPASAGGAAAWLETSHVDQMTSFFKGQIESYYRALADEIGKPEAVYFLEKAQPTIHAGLFHELYDDTREVFTLRHPFDVLCSVRAFFPEVASYQTDDYICALRLGYDRLLDRIDEGAERSVVVSYSQLVCQPDEVLDSILEFADLPPVGKKLETFSELDRGHVTSGNPERSLGRWRRDLTTREIDLAKGEFADTLLRIRRTFPTFEQEYTVE